MSKLYIIIYIKLELIEEYFLRNLKVIGELIDSWIIIVKLKVFVKKKLYVLMVVVEVVVLYKGNESRRIIILIVI